MAPGAEIAADGGAGAAAVVAWSDGATRVRRPHLGDRRARRRLRRDLRALRARHRRTAAVSLGRGGRWLLDPRDVRSATPGARAAGQHAARDDALRDQPLALVAALNGGSDVTVTTVQPRSSMAGDITVTGPLAWSGPGDLRLEAERDIRIDAAVTTSGGDFAADAARSLIVNRSVQANGDRPRSALTAPDRRRRASPRRPRATSSSPPRAAGSSLEPRRAGSLLRRLNPHAGSNIQVYSASGRVDIAAGAGILLGGGTQGGQLGARRPHRRLERHLADRAAGSRSTAAPPATPSPRSSPAPAAPSASTPDELRVRNEAPAAKAGSSR